MKNPKTKVNQKAFLITPFFLRRSKNTFKHFLRCEEINEIEKLLSYLSNFHYITTLSHQNSLNLKQTHEKTNKLKTKTKNNSAF